MAGSTHSIPTLAPGMYDYTNVQGTQSTSSNSLLESHMSQLSRTMLQLAQTNQVIATAKSPGYGGCAEATNRCFQCLSSYNGTKEV